MIIRGHQWQSVVIRAHDRRRGSSRPRSRREGAAAGASGARAARRPSTLRMCRAALGANVSCRWRARDCTGLRGVTLRSGTARAARERSRKNSRIHKTDTSPSSCSVDERRSRYGKQAEALTKALISLMISLLRGASCIIPPLMCGERSSYSHSSLGLRPGRLSPPLTAGAAPPFSS